MADTDCGTGSFNLACNTSTNEAILEGSNGSDSVEAVLELRVPAGTNFYNSNGDLVYTVPSEGNGEPDKTKIKIPPSA